MSANLHRDRWCVILGVSSGMGAATADALARSGAHILGVHFDTAEGQERANAAAEQIRRHGRQVHFYNANAASPRAREELLPRFAELTGGNGISVVVHSLAFGTLMPYIARNGEPGAITARQMDMTLNVMAHSLVYWVQDLHDAGLLREGAKVFAMTSAGDQKVTANYGAVSAAKCALESHVRQLALELAPDGVSVNSIRAGVTITPSLERIPEHEALIQRALSANPHGRLTTPHDVAEAIVVMSRTASSWITGNVIGVDGGEGLTT